jgi:ligand-binding SRPBCC domain-containing protein
MTATTATPRLPRPGVWRWLSSGPRFTLRRRQLIPRPIADVFPFFEDPANLEVLTPRWLGFRIVDRPAEPLTRGSRIEYRLRLFGVQLRWHTVIERYDPGRGFVDVQERGPYREWVHCHEFSTVTTAAEGAPAVLMEDRVDYRLPFGRLGALAAPAIAVQLGVIFGYRLRAVRRRFAP